MKELCITEDMLHVFGGNLGTGRSDSYGKPGGRRGYYTNKYPNSRKRYPYATRERESPSLFRYDREPSRSPSPPQYKTRIVSSAHSLGVASSSKFIKIESDSSHKYTSSNRYSTKRADSRERSSSRNSNQSVEKEESASLSSSQASCGSRDSVNTSGKKRQITASASYSGARLQAKVYESHSESDDPSVKSDRQQKDYTSKAKRHSSDRWSSKDPCSAHRTASDHSDTERPKKEKNSSSKNVSSLQSPTQLRTERKSTEAAQVESSANQVHPTDLKDSPKSLVIANKQEACLKLDPNCDQGESRVHVTAQQDPKTTVQYADGQMSCTPIRTYDFERDETPPAEVVEATAEWCRSQNFPPNFDSVSLQDVFQYYQSSMAAKGTNSTDEGGTWRDPVWQKMFQQRDQLMEQHVAAVSDAAPSVYDSPSAIGAGCPRTSSTAENSKNEPVVHFPKPILSRAEQPNQIDVHVAGSSNSAFDACSSHLHNAKDQDSHQLSDGEVQQHLKLFLNKQEEERRFNSEHACTSAHDTMWSAEVGARASMTKPAQWIVSEQTDDAMRYQGRQHEASLLPSSNLGSRHPDRVQGGYSTLESTIPQAHYHQERDQESFQHLPSQSYLLKENMNVCEESRIPQHPLPNDCSSMLDAVACTSKRFYHRYNLERTEPTGGMNRYQWKEGEHVLNRSRESTGDEIWRVKESRYVQEPCRRDDSMETARFGAYTYNHPESSSPTACKAYSERITTRSSYVPSYQTSLDCSYQLSSVAPSDTRKEMGICEDKFRGLQLKHSNEPTARQHFQFYSPSSDKLEQSDPVEKYYGDVGSSLPSSYQQTGMDKFRCSPTDAPGGKLSLSSAETNAQDLALPNQLQPSLKFETVCTPTNIPASASLGDASCFDSYDVRVPQEMFDNPSKQDELQRLQSKELAERDQGSINFQVINKDRAQDIRTELQDTSAISQTNAAQSLDMKTGDTQDNSDQNRGVNEQVLPSKKRKLSARKFKCLQKLYYKVKLRVWVLLFVCLHINDKPHLSVSECTIIYCIGKL